METWDSDDQTDRSRLQKRNKWTGRRREEFQDSDYDERRHPRKQSRRQRTLKDNFWDEIR